MVKNVVHQSVAVENVNTNVVNQSDVFNEVIDLSNAVKTTRPSVLKSAKPGKKKKGKKRVHFIDSEPLDQSTLCERFVRLLRYLWTCTQSNVKTVLSK